MRRIDGRPHPHRLIVHAGHRAARRLQTLLDVVDVVRENCFSLGVRVGRSVTGDGGAVGEGGRRQGRRLEEEQQEEVENISRIVLIQKESNPAFSYITDLSINSYNPNWSPNKEYFAFISEKNNSKDLWISDNPVSYTHLTLPTSDLV